MNRVWTDDPDWTPDWTLVLSRRIQEPGSAVSPLAGKIRLTNPKSLTRQQIVDFYEELLSKSYEDWHGMNDEVTDGATRLSRLENQNNELKEDLAFLRVQLGRAGRRLYGLLGLIEKTPPPLKFGSPDVFLD